MVTSQTCIFFQHLTHFRFVFHIRIEYDVFVLCCWLPVLEKSQLSGQTHQILAALGHYYLEDIAITQKEESAIPLATPQVFQGMRYAAFCILSKENWQCHQKFQTMILKHLTPHVLITLFLVLWTIQIEVVSVITRFERAP